MTELNIKFFNPINIGKENKSDFILVEQPYLLV